MSDRFEVRLFYGRNAMPPALPGGMAIHTWNIGTHSRDMEVDAGRRRPDIGRAEVLSHEPGAKWEIVYQEQDGAPHA